MARNKNMFSPYGLVCIFLIVQYCPPVIANELKLPEDFKVSAYFAFYGSEGIDWDALYDPENNAILTACLRTAMEENLKQLGKADLHDRLVRLERGGLIKKSEERYRLAFPAIVGQKRAQLQKYAEQAAIRLLPLGEKMIAEIRAHLKGQDEMLYHILWSIVMDGPFAWNTAKAELSRQITTGDTSIENKAWLIYPHHPFRAGTNSYNISLGHLRITWSPNTPSPTAIYGTILQYQNDLVEAIEQKRPIESTGAKESLRKYGLVDDAGKVNIYTLESNSEVVNISSSLSAEFSRQLTANLDVIELADMLDVSPGAALVVAYHEICWQLLQSLAEKKTLEIPPIVTIAGTNPNEAYQLVSIGIIHKTMYPFLETEISEQEKKTIRRFNDIKQKIRAGEKYFNLSTPADALLSFMSAFISKDADAYRNIQAIKITAPTEFGSDSTNQYKYMCIYRIQACPNEPAEGDVHPIYVMSEGQREFSDVEVFIYHQDRWQKLFNNGNPRTDWREAVNLAKSLME